jgi:hypothetical protein
VTNLKVLRRYYFVGAGTGVAAGAGAGADGATDGATDGAPKLTFGGVAIAFSLSTVNCSFSLYPKSIAVRFDGNWRASTL